MLKEPLINSSFPRRRESMRLIFLDSILRSVNGASLHHYSCLRGDDENGINQSFLKVKNISIRLVCVLLIILPVLSTCSKTNFLDKETMGELVGVSDSIFVAYKGDQGEIKEYPGLIGDFIPLGVFVRSDGLYIKLEGALSGENGLFVPRPGIVVKEGEDYDPSFKKLGHRVYQYNIKG